MRNGHRSDNWPDLESLATFSASELARWGSPALNLAVARDCLGVEIADYSRLADALDSWAADIECTLTRAEAEFHRTPSDWKNDLDFFRLGLLCWYIDEVLLIRYREDQRDLDRVVYTDPRDLFLPGLVETRQGTCATMPTLHVALGWRLGWPVSLAVAGWHVFCRFDDGQKIHNIEATRTGGGGFHSHPDREYRDRYGIRDEDVQSGSDLNALDVRQMLGLFVAFRARHWQDLGKLAQAWEDYRLCLLFPNSRLLHRKADEVMPMPTGSTRFWPR